LNDKNFKKIRLVVYFIVLGYLIFSSYSLHSELESYEKASIEFKSEEIEGVEIEVIIGGGSGATLQFCNYDKEEEPCINLIQKLKVSFDQINYFEIGFMVVISILIITEIKSIRSFPKI